MSYHNKSDDCPDWDNEGDLGPEYWEEYMGGPDDSVWEDYVLGRPKALWQGMAKLRAYVDAMTVMQEVDVTFPPPETGKALICMHYKKMWVKGCPRSLMETVRSMAL